MSKISQQELQDRSLQMIKDGRIIYPLTDFNGTLTGVLGRSVNGAQPYYLSYGEGFTGNTTTRSDVIILCEGTFDALYATVHEKCDYVLGYVSLNPVPKEALDQLSSSGKKVIVFADNDNMGHKMAQNVIQILKDRGIKTFLFSPKKERDLTEYLNAGHTVQEIIEEANMEWEKAESRDEEKPGSPYSYESFVRDGNNQQAFLAALDVIKNIGKCNPPLYIYGRPGSGKTHLLYAIRDMIKSIDANYKVVQMNADEFKDRVIESIRNTETADSLMSFRNHTRSADVFLFDDIDDLAASELNMAEFRFLFDYLYEHGKQIVITGHEPADQLEGIDERILSRLAWGKCVKISHRSDNE